MALHIFSIQQNININNITHLCFKYSAHVFSKYSLYNHTLLKKIHATITAMGDMGINYIRRNFLKMATVELYKQNIIFIVASKVIWMKWYSKAYQWCVTTSKASFSLTEASFSLN